MTPESPEALNHRLSTQEFLTHPADIKYFHNLTVQILAMERGDDNLARKLPIVTEAGAWAKAYRIYRLLQRRDGIDPPITEVDQAKMQRVASFEASWNRYLQFRLEVLEYVRRGDMNRTTLQFLGLHPNDLNSPTTDDEEIKMKYGVARRPDWADCATRIRAALGQWESMSPNEKAGISHIMAARRESEHLAARIAQLETAKEQAA